MCFYTKSTIHTYRGTGYGSCVVSAFLMDLTVWPSPGRQFVFHDRCQPYSQFHMNFLHLFPFCFIYKWTSFCSTECISQRPREAVQHNSLLLKQKVSPHPHPVMPPQLHSLASATIGHSLCVRWAQADSWVSGSGALELTGLILGQGHFVCLCFKQTFPLCSISECLTNACLDVYQNGRELCPQATAVGCTKQAECQHLSTNCLLRPSQQGSVL